MTAHPVALDDPCVCGHPAKDHTETHCFWAQTSRGGVPLCTCAGWTKPKPVNVLDLTSLPPQAADAILDALPDPDVNLTRWDWMVGEHAYLASTVHDIAGVKTTVKTVASFSELSGDDWMFVHGLDRDEWDDYREWMRAA